MPKLVTENNWPNAKVIASTIVGFLVPLYLTIAPILHLPTFDPAWMQGHIEEILTGVVAIMAIVAYFKKPAPGDGVKEQ